jgi:SNF2 family DNA or RNA helicase
MLTTDLYPYQEPVIGEFIKRGNLMVAWEMGLGKTLAAIACAERLRADGVSTCLVICPSSLKYQWAGAIAQHTDVATYVKKMKGQEFTLPAQDAVAIIDGTPKQRKSQFRRAYSDLPRYAIVSYETVVSDPRWVRKLGADMIVLDEASAIKNFTALRTKAVKRMSATYRMALTGTPIENRPDEAYSIMQWVDETVLGSFDIFERTYIVRDGYGNVDYYKNLPLFHRKMGEAMTRKGRTDSDVAPYLPDTDIGEWYVECDPGTVGSYNSVAADLLSALKQLRGGRGFDMAAYYTGSDSDQPGELGRIMSRQLALDLLLDHPDLVINSALDWQESEAQRRRGVTKATWPGSKYCFDIWQAGLLDNALESAKLTRLVKEVKDILSHEGSKIIIFSRFKYMLSIIEDALGVPCVQYHGDMDSGAKAGTVKSFTDKPDLRVFLSSHAGAYGTDMHMANWLINYDLPWSSGKADQINGRHQRAASEFDLVYVRNLITRGTVNERQLKMLEYKRSLSAAVVDGKISDTQGRIYNDLDTLASWLEEPL